MPNLLFVQPRRLFAGVGVFTSFFAWGAGELAAWGFGSGDLAGVRAWDDSVAMVNTAEEEALLDWTSTVSTFGLLLTF